MLQTLSILEFYIFKLPKKWWTFLREYFQSLIPTLSICCPLLYCLSMSLSFNNPYNLHLSYVCHWKFRILEFYFHNSLHFVEAEINVFFAEQSKWYFYWKAFKSYYPFLSQIISTTLKSMSWAGCSRHLWWEELRTSSRRWVTTASSSTNRQRKSWR